MAETFQVNIPLEGPLDRVDYFAMRAVPGLRLCLRLAVGTAALGGAWGTVDQKESVRVLLDAWNEGYLLVDTSPNYLNAEEVVGEALKQWKGTPPVVCTKLEGEEAYSPPTFAKDWRASMTKQFETSTRRFGGRKIDGLAMHDAEEAAPEFQRECHEFLGELLDQKKIGVAGLGGGGPTIQPQYLDTGRYRYVITFKRLTAVSLQSMRDTVPACRRNRAAVMVGSAIFMGLLGSKFDDFVANPPEHVAPVFMQRAKDLQRLADDTGISLTHLALRFVWSMPAVDFVLAGAGKPRTWADTKAAFHAGPLPADLYRQIWDVAQSNAEPVTGG